MSERGPELLEWVAGYPGGAELTFVDDGSSDRTVEVIEQLIAMARHANGPRVRLVRRSHEGKGAAVSAGLLGAATPIAGFCDVDLSTPLDQFGLLVKAAERELGLVIASRDTPGAELVRRQSAVREWLGRQYNRLVRLTLLPGINDTQCGAKVAPTALWRDVLARCVEPGLAWDVELLTTARQRGHPVLEVPVSWTHDDRSRVRFVRDGIGLLTALPRIARRARRSSPALVSPAVDDGVFDEAQAQTLVDHGEHWWFRAKAAAVSDLLGRHPPARQRFLVDIGAGAGAVTARIRWPGERLALDGNASLARTTQERGIPATVAAVTRAPLAGGVADVVCLLDVIEHAVDPVAVLREASRVLAPGGRLVVTVPAHAWLWSQADELLGHRRRYHRQMLTNQLRAAGFEPVVVRHLFGWLVPLVWFVRRACPAPPERQLGLGVGGAVTALLARALSAAERAGPALPAGTSLVAIAAPGDQGPQPEVLAGPVTR